MLIVTLSNRLACAFGTRLVIGRAQEFTNLEAKRRASKNKIREEKVNV